MCDLLHFFILISNFYFWSLEQNDEQEHSERLSIEAHRSLLCVGHLPKMEQLFKFKFLKDVIK